MAEFDRPNGVATLAEKLLAFAPAKQLDRLLASDVAKLAQGHANSIERLQTDAARQFKQMMESGIAQQANRYHETIASLKPAINYHLAERIAATEQPWIEEFERMKKAEESMRLAGVGNGYGSVHGASRQPQGVG